MVVLRKEYGMAISERDIAILDFMYKQDKGTLTEEDWDNMDELQKDNENWQGFKEVMKEV